MADSDMFMTQRDSTQNQQEEYDDLYTSLQTAITVRQCKTLQKKERLKLLNESIKQLNNDFKTALTEKKNIEIETMNISNQKNMAAMNLKSVKCSRASLDTVLCNLTNKVASEKAITLSKKKEYEAHIQDAEKAWQEYKLIYEEFPLAAQRQELVSKIKKVEIDKKIALVEIEGLKRQRKLRKYIEEKRFFIWGVKLATLYSKLQEVKANQIALKTKKSDLEQELAKLTLNKKVKQLPDSFELTQNTRNDTLFKKSPAGHVSGVPKMLMFQMPQLKVPSPIRGTGQAKPTKGGSVIHWASLLGSRVNDINKSVTQSPRTEQAKAPPETNMPHSTHTKTQTLTKLGRNVTNIDGGRHLSNNSSSNIIPMEYRKRPVVADKSFVDYKNQPTQKKVCNIQKPLKKQPLNKYKSAVPDKSTFTQSNKNTVLDTVKDKNHEVNNKENEKVNPSTPSNIRRLVSNLTNTMTNTDQLKRNAIPRTTEKDKPRHQHNQENQPNQEIQPNQANQPNPVYRASNIPVTAEKLYPAVTKTDHNKVQITKKQDMYDSGLNQTDLNNVASPLELDEAAKLVYERIAAESPRFVYPRGDVHKAKLGTVNEEVVRSKYFTNDPSQNSTLNITTMNMPEEIQQQMPFSPQPEDYHLMNSPMDNININSPPNAPMGQSSSPAMNPFGKPRAEEQKTSAFGFNFKPEAPKAKSFFSLF